LCLLVLQLFKKVTIPQGGVLPKLVLSMNQPMKQLHKQAALATQIAMAHSVAGGKSAAVSSAD
jgi:hypothetical protein